VHIALLGAFWPFLNHMEVWPYLHAGASSKHVALALSTISIPQENLGFQAQQQLVAHFLLLLKHDSLQVQLETLKHLVQYPLSQDMRANVAMLDAIEIFLKSDDPSFNELAARALISACTSQKNANIVKRLAAIDNALVQKSIVGAYENSGKSKRDLRESAHLLIETWLGARKQPGLALRLAFVTLTPQEALAQILQAQDRGLLHPGAVESVAEVALQQAAIAFQPIEFIESQLRSSSHVPMRRLGLYLLAALGEQHGWTEQRIAHLQIYREDKSDLWISDAAALIRTTAPLQALASDDNEVDEDD
jgi:hypothetical protein